MKEGEQSTALETQEQKALVSMQNIMQHDPSAMAILNNPDIPPGEAIAIVKDMVDGVNDMMQGVEEKLPILALRKHVDENNKEIAMWFFQDEKDPVKSFTGVVLWSVPVNAFFHDLSSEKKTIDFEYPTNTNLNIPYCKSIGGIEGSQDEQDAADKDGVARRVFGRCGHSKIRGDCWLNKFGSSANRKGKGCANKKRLIVWREGDTTPFTCLLPTMSVPVYDEFASKLKRHKPPLAIHRVYTGFAAEIDKRDNQTFAKLVIGDFEEITDHKLNQEIFKFRQSVKEIAYGKTVEVDET